MLISLIVLFMVTLIGPSWGANIGCFVDGECLDSISVGVSQRETPNQCLTDCKEAETCHQFTFFRDDSVCVLFNDCTQLSDANCEDCVSGDATCDSLVCNEPGSCNGLFESVEVVNSPNECIEQCVANINCEWWNYDSSDGFCTLLSSCLDIANSCSTCTHGSKDCGEIGPIEAPTIIFIAGGSSTTTYVYQYDVEAIDLKNPAYVCGALPDVGVSSLFATGNTYNGKAVFCGGNLSEDDCYIFNPENQMWESFAGLLAPRRKHASVQLTEDSFWILGGEGSRSTSEYYDPATNLFVEGPDLPRDFYRHCAAKLGETIVIGGGIGMWNTFLMFDWDSQTWTQMPDMPTGRDNHRCEIIETENGKELWVMGGYRDGEYFDDVEIFKFNSMQWSTGVRLPGPRDGHSTAVVENNIIVIGGQNSMNALDSILKWNPELNDWEYLELGLDGPRSFFGATLVDERSGVTCS